MKLSEVRQAIKDGKNADPSLLVRILKIAKNVYYNDGEGLPPRVIAWFETNVTDKVFDDLERTLKEIRPNSSYFSPKNTGAPIKNAKARKVELPVPMASLDKPKPDSKAFAKFILKGPFVLSAKVDGVSLLILTKSKKLYTRGNGTVGQDISHMWDALHLPKSPRGNYIIRAEMIISKAAFESNFSGKKNARNTMSGLVNSGALAKELKHVDVLGYAVMGKKPSEAFPLIEKLGFKTPFWKVVNSLTVEKANKYLVKVKAGNHEADGLVVAKDVVEQPSENNPVNTIAFKNNELAEAKEFTVKEVLWTPSKHGLLKPVLLLKPQVLDGVTIGRSTAFNGRFVYNNKLGPGAKVELVRSGGVIPDVQRVTKPAAAPQMPEEYEWSGADIRLVDATSNDTVSIKKIAYFFKYLGAEGVSGKFFTKLYDAGYTTLRDILSIRKKDLLELPGVQDKTASLVYLQIQKTKEATLADYMTASGCFPSTVASTRINKILDTHPDILHYSAAEMKRLVSALPGFSTITTKGFVSGATLFKDWAKNLKGLIHVKEKVKAKTKSSKLKKVQVVPTGFRFDPSLVKYIEENGGTVQGNISKETTHVVTKDLGSSSGKIQKAKSLGLKVMSLDAFKKAIGL